MKRRFLLLTLVACGDPATGPEEDAPPVLETPILALPESIRGLGVYQVFTDDVSESSLGRLFPTLETAQRFEYEGRRFYGAVLDFGNRVNASVAHLRAFPLGVNPLPIGCSPSTWSETGCFPRLYGHRMSFSTQGGAPHLYMAMDRYVIYIAASVDPRYPEDDVTLLTLLTVQLAEQIVELNPDTAISPSVFYVFIRPLYVEPAALLLRAGSMAVFRGQIEYALLDAEEGDITLTITQREPPMTRQTVYPVRGGGIDTLAFADSLLLATEGLPEGGSIVTVTATLSPPYVSSSFFGGTPEDLGDGRWRYTAGFSVDYTVR